jgi:hypothetical protein
MNRTRLIRNLRLAFSAMCGIACLILVVLWVRSYSALESWMGRSLHMQSAHGKLIVFTLPVSQKALLRKVNPGFNGYSKVPFDQFKPSTELSVAISGSQAFSARYYDVKHICTIPFWTAVLFSAVLPIPSWTKWKWRFSLRTLLIATTLVAVGLGAVVCASR